MDIDIPKKKSLLEIKSIRLKCEDDYDIDFIRSKFIAYSKNDDDKDIINTNTNNDSNANISIRCPVKGCQLIFHAYIDLEMHIPTHTNQCQICSKIFPNQRILDMHLEEVHSPYFAVASLKKASYVCLVDGCDVLSLSGIIIIIIIIYFYVIIII